MSGKGDGGERTEKATPKKRKKARSDGSVGNTPELGAWLGMLVATFVIPHVAGALMDLGTTAVVQIGTVIRHPTTAAAVTIGKQAFRSAASAVLPMAVLIGAIGVMSVASQGGIWLAPKLLKPTFKRLNPLSGLKRMFGAHAAWNLAKSLLKSVALGVVVWMSVRSLVPTVMGSGSLPLSSLVTIAVSSTLGMLRYAAAAGVVMALADYAVVKRRNDKSLKMSKHEIKEEMKSSEGDPRLKGQVRSRQMAMRRNRMMADVPTADVVVVNPTHVAVALKYDPAKGAPRVVAKGSGEVAAKLRERAAAARVPMVQDIPLARALHASCELGQEVPAQLFTAVARVLAFVMHLGARGVRGGFHRPGFEAPATEGLPKAGRRRH